METIHTYPGGLSFRVNAEDFVRENKRIRKKSHRRHDYLIRLNRMQRILDEEQLADVKGFLAKPPCTVQQQEQKPRTPWWKILWSWL